MDETEAAAAAAVDVCKNWCGTIITKYFEVLRTTTKYYFFRSTT